jgi:hypothetical protein
MSGNALLYCSSVLLASFDSLTRSLSSILRYCCEKCLTETPLPGDKEVHSLFITLCPALGQAGSGLDAISPVAAVSSGAPAKIQPYRSLVSGSCCKHILHARTYRQTVYITIHRNNGVLKLRLPLCRSTFTQQPRPLLSRPLPATVCVSSLTNIKPAQFPASVLLPEPSSSEKPRKGPERYRSPFQLYAITLALKRTTNPKYGTTASIPSAGAHALGEAPEQPTTLSRSERFTGPAVLPPLPSARDSSPQNCNRVSKPRAPDTDRYRHPDPLHGTTEHEGHGALGHASCLYD